MAGTRSMAGEVMTSREAEEYLRLAPHSLDVDRSSGRLGVPYVRKGTRMIRYRRADLDRWLEQGLEVPVGAGKSMAGKRGRA